MVDICHRDPPSKGSYHIFYILAPVIYNHNLQIGVSLLCDRSQGVGKPGRPILSANDHRYQRPGFPRIRRKSLHVLKRDRKRTDLPDKGSSPSGKALSMCCAVRECHAPVTVQGHTDIPVWPLLELTLVGIHGLYLPGHHLAYIHKKVHSQGLSHLIKGHIQVKVTTSNSITEENRCGPMIRMKLQRRWNINQFGPKAFKEIYHLQKRSR